MAYLFKKDKDVTANIRIELLSGEKLDAFLMSLTPPEDADDRVQYEMHLMIGNVAHDETKRTVICEYEKNAHEAFSAERHKELKQYDVVQLGSIASRLAFNLYTQENPLGAIMCYSFTSISGDGENYGYQFLLNKEAISTEEKSVDAAKPIALATLGFKKIEPIICGNNSLLYRQGDKALLLSVEI